MAGSDSPADTLRRHMRCQRLLLSEPDPVNRGPALACDVWEIAAPIGAAWRLLDASARDRAQKFRKETDANLFVTAHAARRLVLASYLDCTPSQLAFGTAEHGKPALLHAPGTAELHFNVSHSGSWVLIAVCRTHPVGVDIERVRSDAQLDILRTWILAPAETRRIRDLDPATAQHALWHTWVRKEAALKAIGCGLTVPMNTFDAGPFNGAATRRLDVPLAPGVASHVLVQDLPHDDGDDGHDGYVAAVAIDLGPPTD